MHEFVESVSEITPILEIGVFNSIIEIEYYFELSSFKISKNNLPFFQ